MEITGEAERWARELHDGQYRYVSQKPYVTHPEHVVRLLEQYGIEDEETLAIGWMHDLVEDTSVRCEDILWSFGWDVAYGVWVLTRNVGREEYKRRLAETDKRFLMVKLCDVLDNIKTLHEMDDKGRVRKIRDCEDFYIPMALKICPEMVVKMREYLKGNGLP